MQQDLAVGAASAGAEAAGPAARLPRLRRHPEQVGSSAGCKLKVIDGLGFRLPQLRFPATSRRNSDWAIFAEQPTLTVWAVPIQHGARKHGRSIERDA